MSELTDAILAGAIVALLGAAFGTVLGHIFSKTRARNERLIECIYRPLLGQLGLLLEKIQDADSTDLRGLEHVRQDGMYFAMDENLKKKTSQVHDEIKGYGDRHDASISRASAIVRELVQDSVPKDDLDKYRGAGFEVSYRGFIEHAFMGTVSLQSCILMGKTPVEALIERRPLLKESDIDCSIGGYRVERHLADEISKRALQRAHLDPIIGDARSQRQLVLRDLKDLVKTLSAKIV